MTTIRLVLTPTSSTLAHLVSPSLVLVATILVPMFVLVITPILVFVSLAPMAPVSIISALAITSNPPTSLASKGRQFYYQMMLLFPLHI